MVEEKEIINNENDVKNKEKADSSASFAELFEQSIKSFEDGSVVDGIVVSVRDRDVLVDIGYKSEGVLTKDEFSNPDNIIEGSLISHVLFEWVYNASVPSITSFSSLSYELLFLKIRVNSDGSELAVSKT